MLSSRVVKKNKNRLTRQALVIRLRYLAVGEADQRVVGLERPDDHTSNYFQNGNRVSM